MATSLRTLLRPVMTTTLSSTSSSLAGPSSTPYLRSFSRSALASAPGNRRASTDAHQPFPKMAPPRRASAMERMTPIDRA